MSAIACSISYADRYRPDGRKTAQTWRFLVVKLRYGVTRKTTLLVSMPPGVFSVTKPVVAPAGTVASMKVSETMVKFAGVPFRKTPVVPVNPCPRMPPVCPTSPESRTSFTNNPVDKRKTVPGPLMLPVQRTKFSLLPKIRTWRDSQRFPEH